MLEFLSFSKSPMSIIISWCIIPVKIAIDSIMSLDSGFSIADCKFPDVAIAPTNGVQAITNATDIFLSQGLGLRSGV